MADVFVGIFAVWLVLTGALVFVVVSYWIHEFLHMLKERDEEESSG